MLAAVLGPKKTIPGHFSEVSLTYVWSADKILQGEGRRKEQTDEN